MGLLQALPSQLLSVLHEHFLMPSGAVYVCHIYVAPSNLTCSQPPLRFNYHVTYQGNNVSISTGPPLAYNVR